MGKKNPFVFTIGFDKSDPDHVYVTELLNTHGTGYAPANDAANHPGRSKKGIGRAGRF